jgi:hypothetical protein
MRPNYSFIKFSFVIFSLFLCFTAVGQSRDNSIRAKVLQENIIGKKFVFDYSKKGDHDETQLTYLGILKAGNGKQFKIMSYCWIWGISKRATNRILVYNARNKYLGNYYLTTTDELPIKIESNQLIFKVKGDASINATTNKISFIKGIPKSIYLKDDNIYNFETD